MKYLVSDGETFILPEKAYKSPWINTHEAKPLRILSEFMEPEGRYRACNVNKTILFFGSARARSAKDHAAAVARSTAALTDAALPEADKARHRATLARLASTRWMCDTYVQVETLAGMLTKWSMARAGREGIPYIVSTGGGPGLMEAANKGAAEVPGGITAGIAISLPFEAGLNSYVTEELAFQHHYFFSRKHNLVYPSRALVACPGGFGTADELFEVLTLLQSGKIESPETVPVVLLGERYWREVINWEKFLEYGVISQADIDRLFFTDDVDAAFEYITRHLLTWEAVSAEQAAKASAATAQHAVSVAAAAHAAALAASAEASRHIHARSLVRPNRAGQPELLPPLKPRPEQVLDGAGAHGRPVGAAAAASTPGV